MFESFGIAVQVIGVLMVLAGAAMLGVVVGKHEKLRGTEGGVMPVEATQRLAAAAAALSGGGAALLATGLV